MRLLNPYPFPHRCPRPHRMQPCPCAASEGRMRGNQPYCAKSTINSPSAPVVTVTPSASSAAAWLCAPEGWELAWSVSGPAVQLRGALVGSQITEAGCVHACAYNVLTFNMMHIPRRYYPLGVDDSLPGDVVVVEAGCRVGGHVLEADADLARALGWREFPQVIS